ncbi:hypothetical protein D7D52_37160 [Nocardia yunnanensis]|uniref:REase associating with pPIWI RE domain-containing protein n=1 Tax=Nocardia yunnanensis TaxID=2382165 RepID=A0A386ZM58_9NOCA|nr:hypothetical protein [Nocardia yunnanensis]AYF78528.1 hypothetical protein D7D52_37160 [Nocardia yunnanensis]
MKVAEITSLLIGRVVEMDRHGIVYQLVRPLRIFVTGPGIAETALESELKRLGLTVAMWPNFDTYDLRVTVPNGEVWALDVKDRANPALLARGSQPLRPDPPYDRAFLVIPQYRFDDRKDYPTVFAHHTSSELRERIELVSDTELLTAIKKQLRAAGSRPATRRTKNA